MTESKAAEPRGNSSVSDYLAAERTFLAWVRTGLALMGFGFVVARFGLFLEEFRIAAPALGGQSRVNGGHSVWFGTALIAMGVLVDLFACWNHVRIVRQLNRGAFQFTTSSKTAVAVAIFLAIVGVAMAIYLILV